MVVVERKLEKVKTKLSHLICLKRLIHCILSYFTRLFTVPLQRDLIYFRRPESDLPHNLAENAGGYSYEEVSKNIIQKVFKGKEEKMKGRTIHDIALHIDMKNYPGWDDNIVDQLRNQFQLCDVKGENVVDFDALNVALDNFGEKSSKKQRKIHFDVIDQDQSGVVDFEEFCTMAYNLGKNMDDSPETLSKLYKNLDRDLTSIRHLTVVEQLQAGLF